MYRMTLAEMVKESKKTDRRIAIDYLNTDNPFRIVYTTGRVDESTPVTVTDMPFIYELPTTTAQTLNRAMVLIYGSISWYFHDLLRGNVTSANLYDAKFRAYMDMAEQTLSSTHYFILCSHVAQEWHRIKMLAHERYQREQTEETAA